MMDTTKNTWNADLHSVPLISHEQSTTSLSKDGATLPRDWPSGPRVVRFSKLSFVLDATVDLVLLILSVTFLAFAITVQYFDNALVDDYPKITSMLLDASNYGPSVFPILFASVLSRAIYAVLMWKLERGERIGVLDLLAGSSSLTSTVLSQIKLGMISFLGVCLTITWAFSPVGGQASFRQITLGNMTVTSPASFNYFQTIGSTSLYDSSERATMFALPNALFLSTLYSTDEARAATVDPWANVKIPLIEEYESNSDADETGWFTTYDGHNYSSLVGVPISKVKAPVTSYELMLETEYLDLDCPIIIPNVTMNQSYAPTGAILGDGSWIFSNYSQVQSTVLKNGSGALKPRSFIYGDWTGANQNTSMGNGGLNGSIECEITTTYVEAEIKCDGSGVCAVSRFRRSQLEHLPAAFTRMESTYPSGWRIFANAFLNAVVGHPIFPNAITYYLNDPTSLSSFTGYSIVSGPDVWPPVARDVFATRLTQLFNTYWFCIDARNRISLSSPRLTGDDAPGGTTNGTTGTRVQVIKAHRRWVFILCVASSLLIIAGLMHPIICYGLTRSCDSVMLNFSSLAVRDNPYTAAQIPVTGSFMTAMERAKLMKDFRLKLGDVNEDADAGRLAIASVDDEHEFPRVTNIKKGRLYE